MRIKNWKSISFSLIVGPDGRWRNSLHKTWHSTRFDALCAGMKVVQHMLDRLQFRATV